MSNLLEQIVGTTVPNGYIYHADSGTDYFYNDGSWINCKSMSRLSESKNTKMNISAAKQITEHNQKNSLQIGTRYKVNEASYVYVGRGVMTKNGSFISEDEQNSVLKMITEASDVVLLQVPPGYRATLDNKSYIKKEYHPGDGLSISWRGEDGGTLSGEQAYAITRKALQDIYNYNRSNANKIGTTVAVDYNGRDKWFTFLGDGFSIGDGTNRVEKNARNYDSIFQQMDDGENSYPPKATTRGMGSVADLKYEVEKIDAAVKKIQDGKSSQDPAKAAPAPAPESAPKQDEVPVPPQEQPKPAPAPAPKQEQPVPPKPGTPKPANPAPAPAPANPKPADVVPANDEAAPATEPSAKEEAKSTVVPAPEVAPTPPPAKVKNPADVLPAEDKEVEESDVESKVPNGFAVQSSSGKSYYKVNGQWYNAETNKVLNSSAAKMVERNAEKVIDQHNSEFSGKRIPIGQKYTSKQGNEYIWTGDKFYDKKGRSLPVTVAKQVEDRVKRDLGITDEEPASTDAPAPAANSANSANAGTPPQNGGTPKPPASVSNINQNRLNQGPAGNDADIDPQRHLDSANDGDDTSASDDIDFDEEPGNDTQPTDGNASDSEGNPEEQSDDSQNSDPFLKRLADKIKAHKYARRITILLGRGDDLSLMAADIILNDERDEARKILQSLNSNDNTQ